MAREEDYVETVTDRLTEILAIKLFEHDVDSSHRDPKSPRMGWMSMSNEDRESYRQLARGNEDIGYVPRD